MLRSAQGVVVDGAVLTDPGKDPEKQVNEDSLTLAETSFGISAVVCDGMGGHERGELASRIAVERIVEVLRSGAQPVERLISAAIERAHAEVYALGGEAPVDARPGSTVVLLVLSGREAIVAHVGDSRAYRVRARKIERLTRDHSVVEALVSAGAISPEQASEHPDANRITRALGIAPEVEPEISAPALVEIGDTFVLCSDGLSDLATDAEIGELTTSAPTPEAACRTLVDLANQRGGHDNISVEVLRVLAVGAARQAGATVEVGVDNHTVVDRPAFTVVMGASDDVPPTVGYEHGGVRPTMPTLVDEGAASAQGGGQGARKTIPLGSAAPAHLGRSSDAVRNTLPEPVTAPPAQAPQGRLFWVAAGVAGMILLLIALWWAAR